MTETVACRVVPCLGFHRQTPLACMSDTTRLGSGPSGTALLIRRLGTLLQSPVAVGKMTDAVPAGSTGTTTQTWPVSCDIPRPQRPAAHSSSPLFAAEETGDLVRGLL